MDRFRRCALLRPPRLRPLLVTAVSTVVLALPTIFGVSPASAVPAAGYAASFIPAGTTTSYVQSVGVNPVTDTVYAGEVTTSGYQLAVMDGSSRAILATLELAGEPLGIAVNSTTNTVYVCEDNQIVVINGESNSVTTTIALPGGGEGGIAVDSTTNMIYAAVSVGTSGSVVVIDGGDNTIVTTVSSGGRFPNGIAIDESTDVVWVANTDTSTVVAISGASPYSIIDSVSVTEALYLAVNPVTDSVYVVSSGAASNPLTVIDGASGTVTTTVPISDASFSHVAVDPSTNVVFAVGFATIDGSTAGGTIVIDGATNTVADVIGPAGYVAAENSATGAVYETSYSDEPAGMWVVTPSATNGISPLLSGPATATATVGVPYGGAEFAATGQPTPTITETGPLPAGLTLATDGVLSGTPAAGTAGTYPITVTASNGIAPDYSLPFTLTVDAAGPQPGAYTPLSPVRVLDTRTGTGGYSTPLGPGAQLGLHVTGVDGVPSTGVTAVVLNVTATDTTASSYITVYPDGTAQPTSSNLNFTAGETIANLVTVPVSSDGQIDFYNNAGSTDLVADLEGYYATDTTGSAFAPAGPSRMLDTRSGTGAPQAPVGPGGTISLQVTGADGVPSSGVTAVALNVTATDTTAASYVTVYPDGGTRPVASNLNFTGGETIPNLVVVPVGADGKVDFYNHAGSTDLVADLEGYYTSGTGSSFVPVSPVRMLDTRNGTGGYTTPVGPGGVITLMITGADGIAASGVTAVVLNVTATDPTAGSYVTVYPDGTTRPTASNLNFTPGETIPNLVVVPVGADGKVDFYNHTGSTDLVADLEGYYTN